MRVLKILVMATVVSLVLCGPSTAVEMDGVPAVAVKPLEAVELITFPTLNLTDLAEEDLWRAEEGLPDRFAVPNDVNLTPDNSGTWESLPDGRLLWRLRVGCPEALSLNLGFTRYRMPEGTTLKVYTSNRTGTIFEYSAADNRSRGQLWTPVLVSPELVIELEMDARNRENVILELGSVGCGYRYFGEDVSLKSGDCNIDVICPEGDDWRDDIPSVGKYIFGGGYLCTGVMVNNTAEDKRPLFLTANHCQVNDINVSTVIVYWNYESPVCGQHGGGVENQFSYCDTMLAASSTSDFKLLELDTIPDPSFGVAYAGWDRSGDVPDTSVAIHHPSYDEKSISFENDPLRITSYLADVGPGDSTHLRVGDWDLGTTEGGSSGSPLFDEDHHIVGQLHGGYADCTNNRPDWYGRLSISWEGNGTPASRLRDHLDPAGTGAVVLNRLGSDQPEPEPEPLPPGDMDLSFVTVAPNPFQGYTEVTYRMNQAAEVRVRVLNITGQLVRDLGSVNGVEGDNVFAWNGRDRNGRPVPSGMYIFYLESMGHSARGQVMRFW